MRFVLLIVLDGWGVAPSGPGNAISLSHIPFYRNLWTSYPHCLLKASGEAVGLPRGEDGNTETGHINLGAGRIVYQDLPRINMAIADGTFFKNPAFLQAISHAKSNNSNLHLLGLVGSGGVHSNIEHLFAILELCKEQQFDRVFIHPFTDGRDSPPSSAMLYLEQVASKITSFGFGKIATVMGRYYAMDRDRRWDRIEKAYKALTEGIGLTAPSYDQAVKMAYDKGQTDEFIEPTIIVENGQPLTKIKSGDSVIFLNFRIDRPRELTKAFVLADFENEANTMGYDPFAVKYYKKHEVEISTMMPPFKRGPQISNLDFITMTEYSKNITVSAVAYPPQRISYPLGRIVAENNIKQLRISESEKERFVTYYFNGQYETPFEGEDRTIIPSPKVATYDLMPQMSAFALADALVNNIRSEKYGFILINFANPDMVAHTGNLKATIAACEVVDKCLVKIIPEVLNHHGTAFVTADHGNAEELIDLSTGNVDTEHSTAPVPFIAINEHLTDKTMELPMGILADVAPTILSFLYIEKPSSMTGRNLMKNVLTWE